MFGAAIVLALLPILVTSSRDGNIKLLEEEVGVALQSCTFPEKSSSPRQRRSENNSPKIDSNLKQNQNEYGHERRDTSDIDQIQMNTTYLNDASDTLDDDDELSLSASALNETRFYGNANRTKRSDPLLNKPDTDQCLSQCVFANLQVVDSRGIPRETELWNRVQTSVTSQQSRAALRDQVRACFEELQSEAEDNGCSYSNKLERCLMLRFADRKVNIRGKKHNK